ncbi:hypothetical protein [Streptomyces sp. NPDC018352]|uniref:hypothetical protein n=1 Tax=Streptomyces sp. NPDC018352 TaxID=3157194 RepID=UPI0033FE6385
MRTGLSNWSGSSVPPEAMRRPLQLANVRLEVAPFLQAAFPRWVRVQTYLRNTAVLGSSAIALVTVSAI